MSKKITLAKSEDSVVVGVCAGLAKHFEIDTFFVRLAFCLLLLLGFGGGLLYLACYFSMENPSEE